MLFQPARFRLQMFPGLEQAYLRAAVEKAAVKKAALEKIALEKTEMMQDMKQ